MEPNHLTATVFFQHQNGTFDSGKAHRLCMYSEFLGPLTFFIGYKKNTAIKFKFSDNDPNEFTANNQLPSMMIIESKVFIIYWA